MSAARVLAAGGIVAAALTACGVFRAAGVVMLAANVIALVTRR